MNRSTKTVTINEVELDVEFGYTEYRAATHFEPPELPELEILTISLDGIDITEICSEWCISEIVKQIEAPTPSDHAADLSDYLYDMQREERIFKD